MKAPPALELLLGLLLTTYGATTLWSAFFRPKLLDHRLLQPRWWGTGPKAGRIGAILGGVVWSGIGAWLIWLALHRLS